MPMEESEIYYHGSGILFEYFDLSHALEGDGKVKFGYGVYVTSSNGSVAHYSGSNEAWDKHFVYTLRIPAKRPDNYIAFKQPVNRRTSRGKTWSCNRRQIYGRRQRIP